MSFSKYYFGFFISIILSVLFGTKPSEAWFEYCDHTVPLGANASIYVNSPYYPNKYPSGSSCRYEIVAPLDYGLNVECNINIDKIGSQCTTEVFYMSIDGDKNLRNSEYFCGVGYMQRKSLFNRFVIAYTSSGTQGGGAFSCYFTTNPQPCDCGWSVTTKITNGVEARINEFPFVAAIYNTANNQVFCGGAIISHRYILSSAHCYAGVFGDLSQILVIVGEHDLRTESETPYTQRHRISRIKIHENYDAVNNFNDIAILTTATLIEWSRGVGPICLPFLYQFAQFDGLTATIAGWGSTSFAGARSNVLMKTNVDIISNQQCQSRYSNLRSSQICTYSPPRDACQFDSGGPLIVRLQRMFAAGIISFGMGCGLDSPGVNIRATSYLNWIQTNTPTESYCRKT